MSDSRYTALLEALSPDRPPRDPFRDILGPVYQRLVPAAERRRTGEFYTPDWLARIALDMTGYDGRGTLVDPACGSGVFILQALARNPQAPVAFYDTNALAGRAARLQWSWATGRPIESAPYRNLDSILSPPDERFDFVVGNPPWINWRNLTADLREAIAPLCDRYGLFPHRGLRARLGSGMDDLSALSVYVWADRLAHEGSRLGFILPQPLLQSEGGGAGFRRFELPGGRYLRVTGVRDFGSRQCFRGAAARAAVVVMEVGAARTVFPVPYQSDDVECEATPVSSAPGAPWAITRCGRAEDLARMRGSSPYRARVGVHSGGAAGIFWVRVIADLGNGVLRIANRAAEGRNSFESVVAEVESKLVRRLLRGRDLRPGVAEPSGHILLPYEDRNAGKAIPEARLRQAYPLTWAYFDRFRDGLVDRAHYRQHFAAAGDPPWSLYNVGDYTFAPHRVAWREQAASLQAAVIADAGTVADAKLTLVPCDSDDEARFLAAVLNSAPARAFVESYAVRTQISTHVLRYLAVPKFDPRNPIHAALDDSRRPLPGRDCEGAVTPADELACRLWDLDPRHFRRSQ